MVRTVRRESAMAAVMPRRSPPTRVMSEAAMATSVPVPMAMPRSAVASAGASWIPPPPMGTTGRGARIVAGQHPHLEAEGAQLRDGVRRLGLDGVGDGE